MRSLATCCVVLLSAVLARAAGAVTVPGTYPTIQAAIDGAPDGAIIQIQPGTYHERLTMYGIARSLTLRGNPSDPSTVVIDGDGAADAVLRMMNCGSNVVVEGITLTHGNGGPGIGGGLFMANSQAVFRDCIFTGNTSQLGGGAILLTSGGLFQRCVFTDNASRQQAGALLMHAGSSTVFERCQFTNNQSGTGDPFWTYGGAILVNESSATFVGCTIADNLAKSSGGGIEVTAPFDGPVREVTLRDTTISGNAATRTDLAMPATEGGGMHIEDNVHAVLERCHVFGNVANRGGGINSYRAVYDVIDSIIEDNQAVVTGGDGGTGGGIYAASVNTAEPAQRPASVTLTRTVVRRNNAGDGGGGIYMGGDFGITTNHAVLNLVDALVADNVAAAGGGVYANRTDLTSTRSFFLLNRVPAPGTYGGGITSVASSIVLNATTVAGNSAADQGGGIFLDQGGTLSVTNSRFHANVSQAGAGMGGGAIAIGPTAGPVPGPVTGMVSGSVIGDNGSGYQITENFCIPATASAVTYTGNTLHGPNGQPYFRVCVGASTTAGLNGIAGKGAANIDAAPSFTTFTATPGAIAPGGKSVLAWSVPGATGLVLDHGGGSVPGPAGLADVTPAGPTTYALSQGGPALGTVAVGVTCGVLGTPFPRTPSDGSTLDDPGAVTLSWYDTAGAATYDVYLDQSDAPSTPVAQDLTGTSLDVTGLAADTAYRWKVVAKTPQCTDPTTSPVTGFRTSLPCVFRDAFDGHPTGWTRSGRGRFGVAGGRLHLTGAAALTLLPPTPSIADGILSVALALDGIRREAHLVFDYRDRRTYREAVIKGDGRLRIMERANGRGRTLAKARRAVPLDAFFTARVTLQGNSVSLDLDGTPVLTASPTRSAPGSLGLRAIKRGFFVEDLCVVSAPAP